MNSGSKSVSRTNEEMGSEGREPDPGKTPVKARLKWFNGPKGFGFVNPAGQEDIDAFLHVTTLQKVGVHTLGEGACLICDIEYGEKGAHVREVMAVLDSGTFPAGSAQPAHGDGPGMTELQDMGGTVKWYKPDQGFGFITPDDGRKDVFIHKTCLDRHNVSGLEAGQRVFITFRSVPKGREVVSFKIIDPAAGR